jgi:hypothetical protein
MDAYSKKNSRLAKHPGNANLHGADVLKAIEDGQKFCTASARHEAE